jgi:hypothetical protein
LINTGVNSRRAVKHCGRMIIGHDKGSIYLHVVMLGIGHDRIKQGRAKP